MVPSVMSGVQTILVASGSGSLLKSKYACHSHAALAFLAYRLCILGDKYSCLDDLWKRRKDRVGKYLEVRESRFFDCSQNLSRN
jgi:hypothetical protein